MYKNGVDINNLQWLMIHKTKLNQPNITSSHEIINQLLVQTIDIWKQIFTREKNNFAFK